jgi:hypothetical protein
VLNNERKRFRIKYVRSFEASFGASSFVTLIHGTNM